MKPLDINRLTGVNDYTYIKEDIKNDLQKYIAKLDGGMLGHREMVYLFEELANSHFIFKSPVKFGYTTEVLVKDGYFQFIPDEQKFAQKIKGIQLPSGQSTEDLILDWKRRVLSEEENASLILRIIKENKFYLLKGDEIATETFMYALKENYVRFVADEMVIDDFLEKVGLK